MTFDTAAHTHLEASRTPWYNLSMQDEARVLFRVSDGYPATAERSAREPFICVEPVDETFYPLKKKPNDHSSAQDLALGFALKKGTTNEEAQEIADYLNKHVPAIRCW